MKINLVRIAIAGACLVLCAFLTSTARDSGTMEMDQSQQASRSGSPFLDLRVHKTGKVHLCVTNYGIMGTRATTSLIDPETGVTASSCEYPADSEIGYLFQAPIWIGAIVDGDTLVSTAIDGWQLVREMYPDGSPYGAMMKRSTNPIDPAYDPDAISEADYIAEYFDTLTDQNFVEPNFDDGRPHIPLGVRVLQESFSWSSVEYEDFVLVRYTITNIGDHFLQGLRVGYFLDGDVYHQSINGGFWEDITGSILVRSQFSSDSLIVGWIADNDGDPDGGTWSATSARGVISAVWFETPEGSLQSYNWWQSNGMEYYDWGPRLAVNNYPLGTGGLGTPSGDVNKYLFMANGEQDYDQLFTRVDHSSDGWLVRPNSEIGDDLANGSDAKFLLSTTVGDLAPDESVTLGLAVVMSDSLHSDPAAFSSLFSPEAPQAFHNQLYFGDLKQNIAAAEQAYYCVLSSLPGDANSSCGVTISDAVFLISYIFNEGEPPMNPQMADVNTDCTISIADAVYLVNYIFGGGPAPEIGCAE